MTGCRKLLCYDHTRKNPRGSAPSRRLPASNLFREFIFADQGSSNLPEACRLMTALGKLGRSLRRKIVIMKKFIVAAAAALLAVGAAQAATYKDGTYTGEGKGRESMIQVQVTVAGGKISDVKVVKHGETEMIIQAPIDTMLPEIVKKNGVEGVDSVGGATLSSEGIKAAVKDALSKAK